MRSNNTVIYLSIDELTPGGKPLTDLDDFLASLQEANVPCVWTTSRSRHQLDAVLRRLGHSAPFIAEGGCGIYLPEDYFHLKPHRSTVRMGRFTCIPIAAPLPAATRALDALSEELQTEVVPLRSLSPRELSQNCGLPIRKAELLRQRDFDEVFFFAGASDQQIEAFCSRAATQNMAVRANENLWSLAIGANLQTCVQQLSGLFERALKKKPFNLALATHTEYPALSSTCNRAILLSGRHDTEEPLKPDQAAPLRLQLFSSNVWERVLELVETRRF